jgi:hypothetical protein
VDLRLSWQRLGLCETKLTIGFIKKKKKIDVNVMLFNQS